MKQHHIWWALCSSFPFHSNNKQHQKLKLVSFYQILASQFQCPYQKFIFLSSPTLIYCPLLHNMTKPHEIPSQIQEKMRGFSVLAVMKCFSGCRDHAQISGPGTRIWNFSDKPIELQVRVGSILKKVHMLKPGSSKRVKGKNIYKAYMPGKGKGNIVNGGMKTLLYYYDETCHPYIWIHDLGCDFSRMVKQQYISLEDLRDCSEIRVFRDIQKGCISVRKKSRPDYC